MIPDITASQLISLIDNISVRPAQQHCTNPRTNSAATVSCHGGGQGRMGYAFATALVFEANTARPLVGRRAVQRAISEIGGNSRRRPQLSVAQKRLLL